MINIIKKIGAIGFGVVSPRYIKKVSQVEVITPELYDTDGYPIERGLMDTNMGVIDPGLRCKTCGGKLKTCSGHFGHIKLARPVLHISYIEEIENILKSFCSGCGRVLLNAIEIKNAMNRVNQLKKEVNTASLPDFKKKMFKLIKKKKECPYCGAKRAEIKFEKPTTFVENGKRIWPNDFLARFEKINDDDLTALGYNPIIMRPEWMILTLLLVPPIPIRPSITLESGDRSEDDLTHKLSDIVRVNQRLSENINAGAPEVIIEDLWDLLQYHLTTYFNNKTANVPPARHRTDRELKTLAQRLSGKTGRFRHSLAGKRVNFCGRSVISPDTNISVNEVGVPLEIAKEVTVPEKVTDWNRNWLITLIKNSPNYPGANYIISSDGKRHKITDETLDPLLEELEPGWVVERHLIDGDIVLFNRQPSLHRLSLMCHTVRVLPGRTFRINPSTCTPYNADFDGDEMNLHIPQTEEAMAEAENIVKVDYNIITPRYGLSIIGQVKDMLYGLYILTKDLKLNKQNAVELVIEAGLKLDLPNKQLYDGKEIASLLFEKDFEYKDNILEIKKGQIVQGVLSQKYVGNEGGLLIHRTYQRYGPKKATELINKMQQLALAVVRKYPYSLSFYDLRSEHLTSSIKAEIIATKQKADSLIKEFEQRKMIPLPGATQKETMEIRVLESLNKARGKIGQLLEKECDPNTDLIKMVASNTGGKILHLAQISGFVGQQALRGKRLEAGYRKRVLPHFEEKDLGPEAHGFVASNYKSGLNPLELFFNCMVGRDAYIDTAVRTPKTGYLQRRLINALQDLKVTYDGTVRDSTQGVIQFSYGGDAIDVAKSDKGGLKYDQ